MRLPEPSIVADDGAQMDYSDARDVWEGGEFSEWVEAHGGWPITLIGADGKQIVHEADCEDALSDDTWDK